MAMLRPSAAGDVAVYVSLSLFLPGYLTSTKN